MAERPEKKDTVPVRESRPAGFTDASYIPRDEAPNLPRVYTYPEAKEEKESPPARRPGRTAAIVCVLCLCLGAAVLGRVFREKGAPPAQDPAPAAEDVLRQPPEGVPAGTGTDNGPVRERPCLGVTAQTVTRAVADYYNRFSADSMVVGVHIYAVDDGGAADRAGLRRGDILTAVDGRPVLTTAELTAAEDGYRPGERAVLTVYRENEYLEIPVEFDPLPPEEGSDPGW